MSRLRELRELLDKRAVQLFALTSLLVFVTKLCVDWKHSVRDHDTWWHLRTGDWIVEHFAVPHTGLFSRICAERPWIAYSWGFEVLLSRAYHWFGLMGIGIFGTVLTLAVTYTTFWALSRLSGRFWLALLLTMFALVAFLFVIMPRPVYFSIIFYIVLLTWLLEANRDGDPRQLYWLPLLFVIWANCHIQFIYGLFTLGLFVGAQIVSRWAARFDIGREWLAPSRLREKPLLLVFFACVVATMIGPYGYKLYAVIFSYSKSKVTYSIILELLALNFRYVFHFVLLLLAAAAFAALGWRKQINLFKLLLLVCAAVAGFRTIRDCWFLALTAAMFLADLAPASQGEERRESWLERGVLAAVVVAFLFLLSRNYDFNERALDREISSIFPVKAVNYLRRNPLPEPLYNDLDWGGFLIWYMPQYPVAIDGRNDLYGDEIDQMFYGAQNGENYGQSPYLNEAGCILLSKKYPLSLLLKFDSRYEMVYEDHLAVIYRKKPVVTPGM